MRGYGKLLRLFGTPVYAHWSLAVVCACVLLANPAYLLPNAFLLGCVLALLLLHEAGHVLAARRRGYQAWSIQLFPGVGLTRFDTPRTQYDAAYVACGGIAVQLMVAAPILVWLAFFGFTAVGPLNAVLAIFGPLSCVLVVLNLFPIPPLDGATAWRIVPYAWFGLRARLAGQRSVPGPSPSSPSKRWLH